MARENRLIKERVENQPIKTPILTADHVKYIKDTIIQVLRDVFSRDPDYTYIKAPDGIFPDFENESLGIVITDVFAYDVEFLPAVTVRINSSNLVPVSFNQNQYTYNYVRNEHGQLIPVWREFSGLYDTSVTLNIHTWDPGAREELVTRIALLFKHVLRDELYADFGFFVKGVSVGGEAETELNGHDELMIFSQSVNIEVLTGWNNRLPVGDSLEGINLQIIGDAAPHIYPPGEPKGGPCGGGGAWKATPTQEDMIASNRIDWIDEIRTCPELVLTDALEFDTFLDTFVLKDDWLQILTVNCGVTLEKAQDQINIGSWLRESLIQSADLYRQRAKTFRANKSSAFKFGSPSTGFRYRFSDGTIITEDNTVIFPDNIRVNGNNVAYFPASDVRVDEFNNVTHTQANVNIDAWANPFTATTLERLEALQFFLVLLEVNSCTRQSPTDLNTLIDDFIGTLDPLDPIQAHQIAVMQGTKANINDYLTNKFLLNKTGPV